jgi:hypothetical protein
MTHNPQSPRGQDALNRAGDAAPDGDVLRRERSRRPGPARARTAPDALQNGPSPERAPAGFDGSSRQALIATAAYYRAERRGFMPGHEQEDWLAAERDIDGIVAGPLQRR